MNRLRLRKRSTLPTPSPTEVQVFADASGVLKAQASNGDISPIGDAAQAGPDVTDGDATTVVAASVVEFPGATVSEPVAGTARVVGATPDLAAVLGEGNDAGAAQIKNLAVGTDPDDAATVSQITGGSSPDVSDGGSVTVTTPEVIEFPDAVVDEPSPGVARVSTGGGSQPLVVGPYPVDFSDIAGDEDTMTLFVPTVGTWIFEAWLDRETLELWDNGDFLWLGQNIGFDQNSQWDFRDPKDQNEMNAFATGFTGADDAEGSLVPPTHLKIKTTDPVQVGFTNAGDPPSQGHVDLYFLIFTPVAP